MNPKLRHVNVINMFIQSTHKLCFRLTKILSAVFLGSSGLRARA